MLSIITKQKESFTIFKLITLIVNIEENQMIFLYITDSQLDIRTS